MSSRTSYVIPQLLPRRYLTIFSGDPHAGKSRLTQHLCVKLALGEPGFWPQTSPRTILFCSERPKDAILDQIEGMGLPIPPEASLAFYTLGDSQQDDLEYQEFCLKGLLTLTPIVKSMKPDLIVLDTLTHFLPPSHTDSMNEYTSMAKRIMRLQRWAWSNNVAILALHHTSKEKGDQHYATSLQRSLGSQAIVGGTIATWILSNPLAQDEDIDEEAEPQARYSLLNIYTHLNRNPPDLYIRWNPDGTIDKCSKSECNSPKLAGKPGKSQVAILELIPDEGIDKDRLITMAQIVLNCAANNVYKRLQKMLQRGLVFEHKDEWGDIVIKKSPKFKN